MQNINKIASNFQSTKQLQKQVLMGQSQSQSQRAESYDTVSISHDLARQLEWNAKSEDEKIGISPPLKLFQQHPTVEYKSFF
jgi:hypothetical protein